MQVSAIQNNQVFTGRYSRVNKNNIEDANIIKDDSQKRENPYNNHVSNNKMGAATKGMIVGLLMMPAASGLMQGCSADADAYAYAESKDSCGGNKPPTIIIINNKDTIVHDTITQIIEKVDTVEVPKGYDSPVIDAIRDFFEANDIDLGNGRIPLSIRWVDEIGPTYNKQLFEEKSSSYDEVAYKTTTSPWSDEDGQFIIGTPLDDPSLIKYSLTSDGKLLMMRYVPKNGVSNPVDKNDWMYMNASVYDINKGGKIVERYKIDDDNEKCYNGTFQPGERPGEIKVTNPYDTDWRYTNVKVVTGDAPGIDEE